MGIFLIPFSCGFMLSGVELRLYTGYGKTNFLVYKANIDVR